METHESKPDIVPRVAKRLSKSASNSHEPHVGDNPAENHRFKGRHVIAELYGLAEDILNNHAFLEERLVSASIASGATVCGQNTVTFYPRGSTCFVVLAESHASIHVYPEHGAIFLDAFTCGDVDPFIIFDNFRNEISCDVFDVKSLRRGNEE